MNSLKQILLNHWKVNNEWINGGKAEEIAMAEGYKSSNAGRRMRELCQEGLLIRELRPMRSGGKSVWYRVKLENENTSQQGRQTSSRAYQEIKQILHSMREGMSGRPSPLSQVHQQSLAL